jgi:uncharacterized protein (DUF58 family)
MLFGDPTKLQFAKQLAAALGFIGLCRADRVKVEALGASRSKPGPVLRGRAQLWRMLEYLDQLQPGCNEPLAKSVKDLALCNSGKGIVVILSDLMDKTGYEAALNFLLARQMDVYVIHILAPEELDPEIKGDLKLVDVEDGDIAEITVSRPLLERYKSTLAAFIGGAREFCTRRGMSYLTTSTATQVDQIVSGYLRRKGLVR